MELVFQELLGRKPDRREKPPSPEKGIGLSKRPTETTAAESLCEAIRSHNRPVRVCDFKGQEENRCRTTAGPSARVAETLGAPATKQKDQ